MLAARPPIGLQEIVDTSEKNRTPAEWTLRYIGDKPEVSMILSGMTLDEHVEENSQIASSATAGHLSENDRFLVNSMKKFYFKKIRVNCTNCRYCLPCPSNVYILELFWAYNHDAVFDDFGKAKFGTTDFIPEDQRASKCVDCGICESHCPQKMPIRKHLKRIVELMSPMIEIKRFY